MARNIKRNQLQKQPKRRRAYSSSATFPRLEVPATARKRRRRQKTEGVRFGLTALKRIIFSARWVSLGLLALTIFALVIIVQERPFYLTYIPVDGAVTFKPEDIVAASNLAGIHIFSADPSKAAEEITELPGVISSTVSLKWPNQVYIEIAEESPVAVWQENGLAYGITSGGRLIPAGFPMTGLLQIIPEMSAVAAAAPSEAGEETIDGEAAETVEETAVVNEDTPVEESIEEVEETAVEEAADGEVSDSESVDGESTDGENIDGENVEGESADNENADSERADVEGADSVPEPSIAFVPPEVVSGALYLRELRPSINELYYRPSEGLSFQDGRGWRVHFGTGNDMNQKLVLYETIINDLLARGINPVYISVSNKSKPYYLAQ